MIPLIAAVTIAIVHTILGPDHYLPFIVIGRARRWSLLRTSALTFVCGLGHVGSSVALGLIGVAAGVAFGKITGWEAARGGIAGWSMLIFGIGYFIWGMWRALKGKSHHHFHLHNDGHLHSHTHDHEHQLVREAVHQHSHPVSENSEEKDIASWKQLTPWLLFIIFVLGPCEPLIPLVFAEAIRGNWMELVSVVMGFSIATLLVMHLIVTVSWFGLHKISFGVLERYSHAFAGAALSLAGGGMVFLGM